MRKNIITLIILTIFIGSCTEKVDYKNLEYSPTLIYEQGNTIVVNQPVSIKCLLNSVEDLSSEVVKITLNESSHFNGELKQGDITIKKGQSIEYRFTQPLFLSFIASQSGEHSIILDYELGAEKVKRQARLTFPVNSTSYNLIIKETPKEIITGKTYSMGAEIEYVNPDSSDELNLSISANMTQGKGVVKLKNEIIFDNTSGASYTYTFSQPRTKAIAVHPDELLDLSFCPVTSGDNKVEFIISDQYLNKTTTGFTFHATGANIIVTNNITNFKLKYATPFNFALNISHLTYTGNYTVNIDNSAEDKGVLNYSNNTLVWGSGLSNIRNGLQNFTFTPKQVSSNKLSYKFSFVNSGDKEEYSTIHEIPFEVEPYPLTSELKEFSALTVKRMEEVTFKMDVTEEKAPDTPFKVSYEFINGSGVVKINGNIVDPNSEITINKGVQSLSFTPNVSGSQNISFTVTDMFGQTVSIPYSVIVDNNTLDAIVTPVATSYVNVPVGISITTSEKDYNGKFYFKYTSSKAGILKLPNGTVVTPNVKTELAELSTTLSYTGSAVGEHRLNFVVFDNLSQEVARTSTITINNPLLTITPSSASVTAEIETTANFTLKIASDGYKGQFRLSATGGNNPIIVESSNVNNGSVLVNSGEFTVSYVPTKVGTEPLKFTVTDDLEQTASTFVNVIGEHKKMGVSASFLAPVQYLGRQTEVKLSASGAAPFTVQYAGGDGVMEQNNKTVSPNSSVVLSTSDKWTFTSSSIKIHNLLFTFTDKNGQIKTAASSIDAKSSEIRASLSQNNNKTLINTITNTTLNLSNTANDDKLIVRWSCAQGGKMNIVSGNEYSKGSLGLQYTPNGTPGTKIINLTVEDKFGASKSINWNIEASYADIVASLSADNVYAEHATTVSYTLSKEQYSGSYYVTATSNQKGLNHTATVAAGTHKVNFTPRSKNDNTIDLLVTDAQNGKATKQTKILVSYPIIKYTRLYEGVNEITDPYPTYIYTISTENYISPKFTVTLEKNASFCYGDADVQLTKINDFKYKVTCVGSGIQRESRWNGQVVIMDKFGQEVRHTENVFFKFEPIIEH